MRAPPCTSWNLFIGLILVLSVSISGCGGGNGGGGSTNAAPVSNAGTDQRVTIGTLVTLNGGGSTDADGNALTYSWTLTGRPAGSTAVLSNATTANPTITPDAGGVYTASLIVNDGTTNSSADTVTITAGISIPQYDPLRTADSCSATVLRTAGFDTGEFISVTTGTETINYASGPISGKITTSALTSDGSGGFTSFNDGTSLKVLRVVDETSSNVVSTDCALSAHPSIFSFDVVYNKMLIDGTFSAVGSGGCTATAATVLFTIQDVTVQGVSYPNAIVWWWMSNPKQPYQTINAPALAGFGINSIPSSSDTGGYAITDVDIMAQDGFVAHVGIVAGTGTTEEVAERTSQRCSSPTTRLATPVALAVDTTNNEIFVTNLANHSVTVYNRTANGTVAPIRTISGAATGLSSVGTIAVDVANSEIVVSSEGNNSIVVFNRTANGNVSPARTISGANTGINGTGAIALDTINNEIIAANSANGTITVYARTANGNVAPLRTITGVDAPEGIAVDTTNNEILVKNCGTKSISVYGRTASGNASPIRVISGLSTGIACGTLNVDTTNNEIVSVNDDFNAITVYSRTASGNVAPIRTIAGAATGLKGLFGAALDTVNNGIVAANWGNLSVTTHSRTANGNIAPIRTIQ